MFRCSECQKEYNIKPEYCDDCGNDVFEEIKEEKPFSKNESEILKPQETAEEKKIESYEIPKKAPFKIEPERKIDYLSWGFLGICFAISLFIVFFAWNPKESNETVSYKIAENKVNKNTSIPSVEKFWDDTTAKKEIKKTQIANNTQNKTIPGTNNNQLKQNVRVENKEIVPKVQEIKKPKNQSNVKVNQNVVKTNTKTKQIDNISTQKVQQKPVVQNSSAIKAKTNSTNVIKPTKTASKTTNQVTVKPVVQNQNSQNTQVQTKQNVSVPDSAAIKKELNNYKISLRNTIGKKIDFANVIGDGTCVVSFKIDGNGKLINRAFSKQSSNTTLNNAVYNAVMSTPNFNPPPSGYKSETLNLKITFYNGNFEISFN